jgi:hypothetical protein
MKKTRSDSKLLNLPDEQQLQLADWLLGGMPYHTARAAVAKEFGVSVGVSSFTSFWQAVCVPQLLSRRQKAVQASEAIVADVARSPGKINDALLVALKQKAFEVCNSPTSTADEIMLVTSMALKIRDQDLKEGQAALARDKFEFSAAEACLKHLPALRTIAAASGVPQRQKVEMIRERLFGALAKSEAGK